LSFTEHFSKKGSASMQTRVAQSAEHANQQTQSPQPSAQLSAEPQAAFADNSPQATQLKSLSALMSNSPQQRQRQALQAKINGSAHARQMHTLQAHMAAGTVAQRMDDDESLQGKFEGEPAQRAITAPTAITAQSAPTAEAPKPNNTGLPNQLKAGIESLSGMRMDHVKVHYNSSKPAQLQAHAYAQGSEIHVAPGQEQHLPHEAWHVVQQAQGRVRPTMQMKSGVAVNDDAGLEAEADVMGAKAARLTNVNGQAHLKAANPDQHSNATAQLFFCKTPEGSWNWVSPHKWNAK
jgi:hypothetical protein